MKSSTGEILSVGVSRGVYPATESDRDTNPGASIKNYKLVCAGDIVFNSMRMWQGAVGLSLYKGIVSPAYTVICPTEITDSSFFGYHLKRPRMLYRFYCYSQGNSKDTLTLKFDKFANVVAVIPSSKSEQILIGAFFRSLDDLITLHQRKRNSRQKGHPNEKAPEIKCIRKARRIGLFWVLAEASHRYCLNIVSRLSKHRSLFILCLHNVEERLFYLMPLS